MGEGAEPGSVRSAVPVSPLLLGFENREHKLCMSDRVSCGLANLQGSLLRQYFRLEKAERSLVSGAAERLARSAEEIGRLLALAAWR